VAASDYLAVLGRHPHDPATWYDLGVLAQSTGDMTAAERDYSASVAGDPGFAPAFFNLGVALGRTNPSLAMGYYRQVVALEPGDAAAHLNLGLLLRWVGQQSAGDDEVHRAVSLDHSLSGRNTAVGAMAAVTSWHSIT
jgi:lipoprotein NlpI